LTDLTHVALLFALNRFEGKRGTQPPGTGKLASFKE